MTSTSTTTTSSVGPHRFLDMTMGAVQGRPLIGAATSNTEFIANARAFFGQLLTAAIRSLRLDMLPASASALASRAATDVNTRKRRGFQMRSLKALLFVTLISNLTGCERYEEWKTEREERQQRIRDTESTLGVELDPKETHLTFTFPELRGENGELRRKAVTFRIPREYIDLRNVLSRKGQILKVLVQFELPGATPWQERPWLRGKQGTPEWDAFSKTWIGKFIVELGSGSGEGARLRFLHSIDPQNQHGRKNMIQDGMAYGLVRYSPERCYTPEHLKDPMLKTFLDAKPTDDPMPQPNCRVDRGASELFSPPEVTDELEVVFIQCMTAARCFADFAFDGLGANVAFSYDKLARWPEIVNPARDLLRSFIVRDASTATPLAPASSTSR